MEVLTFYKELDDYEEIKKFLDLDSEKFENPTEFAPFQPGILV